MLQEKKNQFTVYTRDILKVILLTYFHRNCRYREHNNTTGWRKFSATKHFFHIIFIIDNESFFFNHEHIVWVNSSAGPLNHVMCITFATVETTTPHIDCAHIDYMVSIKNQQTLVNINNRATELFSVARQKVIMGYCHISNI